MQQAAGAILLPVAFEKSGEVVMALCPDQPQTGSVAVRQNHSAKLPPYLWIDGDAEAQILFAQL
jgi:hypothetical protein